MLVQAGSQRGPKFLFAGLWDGVAAGSTFQKTKAHMSRQQAEALGNLEDWAGNAAVDAVAQQAAEDGGIEVH